MIQTVLVADFGTSNVRVNAIGLEQGLTYVSTSVSYGSTDAPDDCMELCPEMLWSSVQACFGQTLSRLDLERHQLRAISFSFFGDSLVPVDRDGEATYNLLLCFDPRGAEEAEQINRVVGRQRVLELIGDFYESGCTGAKIAYFLRHMPEAAAKTEKYYTIGQYILRKLGLPDVNDVTMACRKSLMDNERICWSQELMAAIGVRPEQLGDIVQATQVLGEISHFGEVELPYPVPVLPGAHDSDCGYVGLGVGGGTDFSVAEVAGTFDHIGMIVPGYVNCHLAFPEYDVWSGRGPLRDSTSCLSAYATSGALLEWFMREIMGSTKQETYRKLWDAAVFDGREGITVQPFFSARKGGFNGMSVASTKVDLFLAIIETLTFETRRCIELCQKINPNPIERIRIGGGGAKEETWIQLRADITGKTFQRMQEIEGSSLGAAMLAAVGIGFYPDIAAATKQMVRVDKTFTPRTEIFARYNERYCKYINDHYSKEE